MFYQPNFCCHCGEKIERTEWKLWTNRRFCELCASDQQLAVFVPRIAAGILLLIGMLGLGSSMRSAPVQIASSDKQDLHAESRPKSSAPDLNIKATNSGVIQSQTNLRSELPSPAADAQRGTQKQVENNPGGVNEPVYYCGAETKKGTPCSRRVKGNNERCWQHAGMPKMQSSQGRNPKQ
jgi:hypothetical protein